MPSGSWQTATSSAVSPPGARFDSSRHTWQSAHAGSLAYATIVAEVDSELVEIDLDDVLDYLDRQPAWLRALIQSLVEHVRRIDERVLESER